jgi:hypothetical protein
MKSLIGILLVVFSLSLYGCAGATAFGRTENYTNAWPGIRYSTPRVVSVVTLDERPYTKDSNKPETFVGLMRGGFGNPFDITTESKSPLSKDISDAVTSGFLNAGTNAYVMPLYQGLNISAGKTERLLVIKIYEWKSDTFTSTNFSYDLRAEVYDELGQLKGSNTVKDSLSVSSALEAGRGALTTLLSAEEIRGAL